MAKKQQLVPTGQVVYYVPSTKENAKAAWKIPALMRKHGAHFDGSCWFFHTADYDAIKAIADKYEGKGGIKFYVIEEFTAKDPEVIARIVRDSISKTVQSIVPSLRKSIENLMGKFDQLGAEDADGRLVNVIRENRNKLKDAMIVATSFAMTDDYADMSESVQKLLEVELSKARIEMGKMAAKELGVKIEK